MRPAARLLGLPLSLVGYYLRRERRRLAPQTFWTLWRYAVLSASPDDRESVLEINGIVEWPPERIAKEQDAPAITPKHAWKWLPRLPKAHQENGRFSRYRIILPSSLPPLEPNWISKLTPQQIYRIQSPHKGKKAMAELPPGIWIPIEENLEAMHDFVVRRNADQWWALRR